METTIEEIQGVIFELLIENRRLKKQLGSVAFKLSQIKRELLKDETNNSLEKKEKRIEDG